MGKTTKQKNTAQLMLQQRQEIEKTRATLSVESIRAAEDKLLHQCLGIVESSLDFASLGFDEAGILDETQLPAAWTFLSDEDKARKIRLAKYACLPTKDVPHGVKMAHEMLIGIIKARATENSGTKVLNLEVSTFPAPSPVTQDPDAIDADYEVIDIE